MQPNYRLAPGNLVDIYARAADFGYEGRCLGTGEVHLVLADDAAVRTAGPTSLARALVACAAGHTPSGALAAGGPTTVLRVRRLGGRPNSLALATAAYLTAAAVLIVPTIALAASLTGGAGCATARPAETARSWSARKTVRYEAGRGEGMRWDCVR